MGASKRCSELILQSLAAEQNLSFEPMWDGKFSAQVVQGGPITLTHQDINRY